MTFAVSAVPTTLLYTQDSVQSILTYMGCLCVCVCTPCITVLDCFDQNLYTHSHCGGLSSLNFRVMTQFRVRISLVSVKDKVRVMVRQEVAMVKVRVRLQ